MGNKSDKQADKQADEQAPLEDIKRDQVKMNRDLPLIVNADPQPDAIRIAIMNAATAECMTIIEIKTTTSQRPITVYDTVTKMLNDSDLDCFLLPKTATLFKKCKKIEPIAQGDSNIQYVESFPVSREDPIMEPGLYVIPGYMQYDDKSIEKQNYQRGVPVNLLNGEFLRPQ